MYVRMYTYTQPQPQPQPQTQPQPQPHPPCLVVVYSVEAYLSLRSVRHMHPNTKAVTNLVSYNTGGALGADFDASSRVAEDRVALYTAPPTFTHLDTMVQPIVDGVTYEHGVSL